MIKATVIEKYYRKFKLIWSWFFLMKHPNSVFAQKLLKK